MNAIKATEAEPLKPAFTLPVWVPVAACAVLVFFLMPRTSQDPVVPSLEKTVIGNATPAGFSDPTVELAKMDVNIALKQANKTISSPYDEEMQKLQKDLKSVGKMLGGLPLMHLASSQ